MHTKSGHSWWKCTCGRVVRMKTKDTWKSIVPGCTAPDPGGNHLRMEFMPGRTMFDMALELGHTEVNDDGTT